MTSNYSKLRLLGSVMFALSITNMSFAQDPAAAPEREKGVWDKSLNFGFNLTNGNSETILLTAGAAADVDYGDDLLSFLVAAKYGEATDQDTDEEEITQNDARVDANYKHLFTDRLYLGTGADFRHDNVADIDYRVGLKPAIGYFFVKNDTVKFNVEVGPGYIWEKVGGIRNDYLAPFIGERLEWQISETAKFYEEAEIILDVDDSENYIITAEAGLEAAISTNLSLIVAVTDIYDNQPAIDREENDLSVITALKVAL